MPRPRYRVLHFLLLPVHLGSACREPLHPSVRISRHPLAHRLDIPEAIHLVDHDVVTAYACNGGSLHEVVCLCLTDAEGLIELGVARTSSY